MNQHDTATKSIERAIKGLEAARPDTHLIYSGVAHTSVAFALELRVINWKEYSHYYEQIRVCDARFMGIDLGATA